ncbi:hypothetical protein [Bacillus alkalisoli]|uniref:hypothetical protein n=1 Tax=Bacillus alkalisoli TaxID=2011008 RepID=UPI000C24A3BF|nr:hypothetical protein [Bacillus alkalisoli]
MLKVLKIISINMLFISLIGILAIHFLDYIEEGRIFSTTILASNDDIEHHLYEEPIVFVSEHEENALQIISNQHQFLNNVTGWGGVEAVNLRNLITSDNWMELKSAVIWLKKEAFLPSSVLNDMENARVLIVITERDGDKTALRYLHRIFHDLDLHLNEVTEEERDSTLWGVTHSFGNTREIRRVNNYVFQNY